RKARRTASPCPLTGPPRVVKTQPALSALGLEYMTSLVSLTRAVALAALGSTWSLAGAAQQRDTTAPAPAPAPPPPVARPTVYTPPPAPASVSPAPPPPPPPPPLPVQWTA